MDDVKGKRFGSLIIVKRTRKDSHNNYYCLCKCDCGKEKEIRLNHLKNGDITSCGCQSIQHHGTGTRLFRIWCDMRQRCNPKYKDRYPRWSGRGITVCEEWHQFKNFKEWALNNGYQDDLSIDRINNDGNYEPLNCRWATCKEQGLNRNDTHFVTIYGETHSVLDWCRILNLSQPNIYNRMKKYGWNIEKAIIEPSIKPRKPMHPYILMLREKANAEVKAN